jgi:subfamily B ATP-binding cassette protein MsbA
MSAEPSTPAQRISLSRLKRYVRYLKPARWSLIGGVIAGIIYSAASGVGLPLVSKVVVPIVFGRAHVCPVCGDKQITNRCANGHVVTVGLKKADPAGSQKSGPTLDVVEATARRFFGDQYKDAILLTACFGLPLLFLIRGLSMFANRYLVNRAGFVMLEGLRQDVFNRMQHLPLSFFHRYKSGDLVSRLITDTEQLRMVIVNISADIVKQPLTLLFALGFIVWISITDRSAMLALIALVSVPLCIVPIQIVARHLTKRSREVARLNGELAAVITESLQSPVEIQSYNLQEQQRQRLGERIRQIFRLSMKQVKYKSVSAPSIEFISVCGLMVALYVGKRNGMDEGTFTAIAMALYACYDPIKKLSVLNEQLKSRTGSQERLEEILNMTDTVPNPVAPKPLPSFPTRIQFERVGFHYETAPKEAPPALTDVNLTIQHGEVVALVGPSGAGKSTFAMMIPRFYDPGVGSVRIGGVDLRELDKHALRGRIALVPQMPVLFNATVAENIRFGRLDATDEEVRTAARKAHVAEFIEGLPAGYQTIIRERGTSLSGGQRQRIAIARAFLKDAPILILDEATSALDSESEKMVQTALRELVKGRTVLMIAHRFSSISLATRILVFESGRITGDGSHDQLVASHAVYRHMNELQKLA